jgi:hypothetical protein
MTLISTTFARAQLCYHRFHTLRTHPKHPRGFDRARRHVAVAVAPPTEFDEEFTSRHWLVRVYRVRDESALPVGAVGDDMIGAGETRRQSSAGNVNEHSPGAVYRRQRADRRAKQRETARGLDESLVA